MWNYDEKLYYAANLMFQCRCDWGDSGQVWSWLEEAKSYLPGEYTDAIDDEYIESSQEDGRHTRDSFPSYSDILKLVNMDNLTFSFKEFIEMDFENNLGF